MLCRPSLTVFAALVAVVQEGDWTIAAGWKKSGIGAFWGGTTIQVVLVLRALLRKYPLRRTVILCFSSAEHCCW
jgi:hypothetical protein